jgi:2-keto-4-pentenoate hydratase/2-oxohepta-3-ene-1,7-dioic acid hydratase in catechol pathway
LSGGSPPASDSKQAIGIRCPAASRRCTGVITNGRDMKIARFSVDGWESYGLIEDERIRVIQGDIFGSYIETQASYPLRRVKLLPPSRARTFWAVGLNYAAHIAHQEVALADARIQHEALEFRPWHKGVHCMIGHEDSIVIPGDADLVHYEGELVIVIGRPTRNITPEEAPHFIFGYTIGNDVSSEGSWHPDISNWRKKGCDTFGPVGPWIETDVVDPHDLQIITRLNGREADRGSTSGMVRNCYAIVSGISKYATLHPGDIILTGAPGAVEQIRPGDVVEIEIPGIGILRNSVIGEK